MENSSEKNESETPVMKTVMVTESSSRIMLLIILNLFTIGLFAHTFYKTFFVVDDSATDFVFALFGFWVIFFLNFPSLNIYQERARPPLGLLLLSSLIVVFSLLISLAGTGASLSLALLSITLLIQNFVADTYIYHTKINRIRGISSVIAVPLAIPSAFLVDLALQNFPLYMHVADNTLRYIPESISFTVSPELTIQVGALLYFCHFILSTLISWMIRLRLHRLELKDQESPLLITQKT